MHGIPPTTKCESSAIKYNALFLWKALIKSYFQNIDAAFVVRALRVNECIYILFNTTEIYIWHQTRRWMAQDHDMHVTVYRLWPIVNINTRRHDVFYKRILKDLIVLFDIVLFVVSRRGTLNNRSD